MEKISGLSEYLMGVAIGVRFRANFSIEDQLGRIIDTILYTKNSFFNPNIFPTVRSNVGQRVLINEKTNDRLHIDNSNFILETQFGDTLNFKSSDFQSILNNFNNQIIKGVMKSFAIKEIVRIGVIKRYLFKIDELAETFVDKTIGKTLEGINDINLRFSKKLPITAALVKKNVNDYNNVIFNIIKRADKDEIFMSVDFQTYYDPFLPSSLDIDFEPFVKQVEQFNSDRYLKWLNSNYLED